MSIRRLAFDSDTKDNAFFFKPRCKIISLSCCVNFFGLHYHRLPYSISTANNARLKCANYYNLVCRLFILRAALLEKHTVIIALKSHLS